VVIPDEPRAAVLCALWAVAAAGVAWYCLLKAQQITYVTLADGRRQARRLPLTFRLLLPLTPNLTPFFRKPLFARTAARLSQALIAAGFEGLLRAEEVMALRVLFPLIFGPFWLIGLRAAVAGTAHPLWHRLSAMLGVLGVLWLFVCPAAWLKRELRARHRSIRRALPFVLDLLTLSVEAGMDFMTAVQRCVERRRIDPLCEELIRVLREIQVGKTRRGALRDMGERVNLPELRSIVNALVQADELGVSIGSMLRIQAAQMRLKRFERAEKLANEAPVKMLAPLMLFIFPAVFLVLLGPVVARLMQQGL
jgi:tight adherence protein C